MSNDFTVDPATEHLYMPSNWVKRVKPDESVALHVKKTTEESKRVRADPTTRLGVSIGPGPTDVIDIINEDGSSDKIIVYLTGGFWLELNGEISAYTAAPLVADGHTVLVVHYDRAPKQKLQDIINQVVRSVVWIIEYAEKKDKKVWLSGHSAGSHLCAMALASPEFTSHPCKGNIRGVVHLAGVFDLIPILSTSVNTVLKLNREEAEQYSPLSEANIKRLSMCPDIVHAQLLGEHDSPAFHQQAERFRDALNGRGIKTSLDVLAGLDHFSLVEDLADLKSASTLAFKKIINQ